MVKIYIVEDDENIRGLLSYALIQAGFEAEVFETGKEFYSALEVSLPGLIVLDIMLPEKDGLTILKELKADISTKKIPVIMLTAKGGEYDKIKGLDSGADDYITKPFSVLELISRIKALLRRCESHQENKLIYKGLELNKDNRTLLSDGKSIELTYKEFELLSLMLSKIDHVFTRDILMEQIWGFDFEGESRTVDMHIKTLRQKLQENGALIKTIRGVGYKIGN